MTAPVTPEVLHYVGCDDDSGGVISVIRALAAAGQFACILGTNAGAQQRRTPPLPVLELPRVAGENIGLRNAWRTRRVAQAVQVWLHAAPGRVFHGHSRAGLLVGLWLHRLGEKRVVVSVHCYGRQRWFYRWAARQLGGKLYWLSPAMRRYYGAGGEGWAQCIPGSVPGEMVVPAPAAAAALRLGGAGLLARWKGWHLVLEGLAQLPEAQRRQVTFEHIGGTSADRGTQLYAEELRALTGRLGLEGQVRWCGPEPDATRLMGAIDALVIASQNEPFSVALLEALAAGVPVLAADSGGTVDIIQPGKNGWLFRSGDADSLAARLGELLADPAARRLDRDEIRRTSVYAPPVAQRWAGVYAGL